MFASVMRWVGVCFIGLLMAPDCAAQTIEPGQELKRAIAPGETHSYEAPLSAGQYLRFALECDGSTRLTVKLIRPNSDVAIVLNDTRQHESPVSLSLIANGDGIHRLTLQLVSGVPAGKYTLRLADARAAVGTDSRAIDAETALREGRLLYAAETASSRRAAILKFQSAIAQAREADDRLVERNALRSLGRTYNLLGESPAAVKAFGDVLDFARRFQDPPLEAEALNNIGLEHSYLGQDSTHRRSQTLRQLSRSGNN